MNKDIGKPVNPLKIKRSDSTVFFGETSALKLVLNVYDLKSDKFEKIKTKNMAVLCKKWAKAEETDRSWSYSRDFKLGNVNSTAVQSDVWVLTMLCKQEGKTVASALSDCLDKIVKVAKYERANIHITESLFSDLPELTDDLLQEKFLDQNIKVFVYKD